MNAIVLFLTAVPLAAILALLLNTLLDRRTAVSRDWMAPGTDSKSNIRSLAPLLLAAAALTLAPTLAAAKVGNSPSHACGNFECSLRAEAEAVERLWSRAPDGLEMVVGQSRIPVRIDTSTPFEPTESSSVVAGSDSSDGRQDSAAKKNASATP